MLNAKSINSFNVYQLRSGVGTPLQHTSGLASIVLSTSDGSAPKAHDQKVGVRCKSWSSGSNIHESPVYSTIASAPSFEKQTAAGIVTGKAIFIPGHQEPFTLRGSTL